MLMMRPVVWNRLEKFSRHALLSFSYEIFMRFQLALMVLVNMPGNKLCILLQQLQFLRVICSIQLRIKERRRAPANVCMSGNRNAILICRTLVYFLNAWVKLKMLQSSSNTTAVIGSSGLALFTISTAIIWQSTLKLSLIQTNLQLVLVDSIIVCALPSL